jgi:outer membrane protein OmpA-like peptidoglycan-associated protein
MYLMDKRVEALIATAKATAGSLADGEYFNSLPTSALLSEASGAYNRGDHRLSIGLFAKAAERRDGQVMKTFSGLYQSFFKRKMFKEAGEAFGKLVELGMRGGRLDVKFLFNVDATEFYGEEPDDLDEYQIWLHEIAKNIVASKSCVQVVGHASRSGTEEYNQLLSEKRAALIYKRLQTEASGVGTKATAIGRGFAENKIGTGTNDGRDAIDRRVEFKMSQCGT